jgi:hypothetical protein
MQLGIYQHYKGNLYQLLDRCRHSETLEELVLYKALYGDFGLWVRPSSMFFENIILDGKSIPRFKFLKP